VSIFKKMSEAFSAPASKKERALYLYVQCDKCGEKLRARVDLWNELSPEFDGKSEKAISYHCRKVLVGEKRCYQSIELILEFDKNHRLVEKQIHGGKYIEEEDYTHQVS
jgi:hypothetical protein